MIPQLEQIISTVVERCLKELLPNALADQLPQILSGAFVQIGQRLQSDSSGSNAIVSTPKSSSPASDPPESGSQTSSNGPRTPGPVTGGASSAHIAAALGPSGLNKTEPKINSNNAQEEQADWADHICHANHLPCSAIAPSMLQAKSPLRSRTNMQPIVEDEELAIENFDDFLQDPCSMPFAIGGESYPTFGDDLFCGGPSYAEGFNGGCQKTL